MISQLFPTARRAILRPKMMYFGMLLACFAWLLQLSPLLAPLWLSNLSVGHGICIELAPVIAAQEYSEHHHQSQHHQNKDPHLKTTNLVAKAPSTSDLLPQHAHHIGNMSKISAKEPHLAIQTQSSDTKKSTTHNHDCSICLAMMAFSLPASGVDLIVLLGLAFAILTAVLYRSLCLRLIVFLRPPSRASPTLNYCHNF